MKTQRKVLKTAQVNEDKKVVAKEKKKLKELHKEEMVNFFQNKICDINNASDSCLHGAALSVINEITNRKKSAASRLKGSSEDGRKESSLTISRTSLGRALVLLEYRMS